MKLSKEAAQAMFHLRWWTALQPREIALIQTGLPLLTMPIADYRRALVTSLRREVSLTELADRHRLRQELLGSLPPPALDELLAPLRASTARDVRRLLQMPGA